MSLKNSLFNLMAFEHLLSQSHINIFECLSLCVTHSGNWLTRKKSFNPFKMPMKVLFEGWFLDQQRLASLGNLSEVQILKRIPGLVATQKCCVLVLVVGSFPTFPESILNHIGSVFII